MRETIELDEFAQAVLNGHRAEIQHLDVGEAYNLPFRAWPKAGARDLVVSFHGAVNRQQRTYPAFGPYVKGVERHAHQVAFADPTLELNEEITISWFAGSSEMPVQKTLLTVLRKLIDDLQVRRVVFVGGSGGGYAALFYSWYFENSVAVAYSPQVIINNFNEVLKTRYYDVAWPDATSSSDVQAILDLRELYGKSVKNFVVYLQSNGDHTHLFNQMAPFLDAVPTEFHKRLIAKASYWGRPGHSGSVPLTEVTQWVHAALSVPKLNVETLRAEVFDRLQDEFLPPELKVADQTANTPDNEVTGRKALQGRYTTRLVDELLNVRGENNGN